VRLVHPWGRITDSHTKAENDTQILNTSNNISTRIIKLPAFPSLTPYKLITDSYTKAENDTKISNTSNNISTRINN